MGKTSSSGITFFVVGDLEVHMESDSVQHSWPHGRPLQSWQVFPCRSAKWKASYTFCIDIWFRIDAPDKSIFSLRSRIFLHSHFQISWARLPNLCRAFSLFVDALFREEGMLWKPSVC